ncbi:hypothetical protein CWATWH0402_2984 [Crocosphaera watsonii WH 0402]|uniref:Uncharacterized protein n=1 Tax=Crocosphaera watsonii WH 0402 TaxID=1284629 RepID=T2JWA5_CROWT|nr:hypothetical protein [Crocosphaera watsonii]CCQ70103.1 hypothetical protein CWATWH0402_2984 [Crocosphaera watsonii WH 0402]
MNWIYYLPHILDREQEYWADIYLLPQNSSYNGQALWLTIEALGLFEELDRQEKVKKLGEQSFYLYGSSLDNMVINSESFTKEELLQWARIWLEAQDLPVNHLLEGSREMFKGKAYHADLIDELQIRFEEFRRTQYSEELNSENDN